MTEDMDRRKFLSVGWKVGAVAIGCAGAWTSFDLLRPLPGTGLGGIVETVPVTEVPDDGTLYVQSAQTYLTRIGDEIVALWHKCPHLGCRVEWCEGSGEFECPCHGSTFNRAGEVRSGPSPRGMDRFVVAETDGVVAVDTGTVVQGPPAGSAESIDEPRRDGSC
ncbi:MAG TPA: Rieske 2Fe-2S domain-containing protein [Acidimicrobiia bacterium]|nr:Rieske 2Fe-2S domain-containing protein [Acidimicrobiia bacterium]